MTEPKQLEALELASAAESADIAGYPTAKKANAYCLCLLEDCAQMIRRLHAENTTLQAGYAAARLEIESLRTRCVEPVGERTTKDYAIEHAEYMAQDAEHQPPGNHGEKPLPLLARDIAADFGVTPVQVCLALAELGFGHLSVNMAITPEMAEKLREYFAHAAQQAPAQAAPELTETAVTAKNPAAPVSSFEDSRTQAVYEVLVNDNYPPAGSNEHWEGWKARLIVDAIFPMTAPVAVAGPSEQQVFEEWLSRVHPSGDAEAVQAQWKRSGDYLEWLGAAPTTQPAPQQEVRPVTPYTCPKCHALWLHWPAEQSGFGMDTLNCRSATHCDCCEKGGVEQLQRLERVPAVLAAPQQEAQEPACSKCHGLGYYDEGHEYDDGTMGGGNYVDCDRCKSEP